MAKYLRDIVDLRLHTVGDLARAPKGARLYCRNCGMTSSADHRDYWHVPAAYRFGKWCLCDYPEVIVTTKHVTYREAKG